MHHLDRVGIGRRASIPLHVEALILNGFEVGNWVLRWLWVMLPISRSVGRGLAQYLADGFHLVTGPSRAASRFAEFIGHLPDRRAISFVRPFCSNLRPDSSVLLSDTHLRLWVAAPAPSLARCLGRHWSV